MFNYLISNTVIALDIIDDTTSELNNPFVKTTIFPKTYNAYEDIIHKDYDLYAILSFMSYINMSINAYYSGGPCMGALIGLCNQFPSISFDGTKKAYYAELFPFTKDEFLTLFNTVCANPEKFNKIYVTHSVESSLKEWIKFRYNYKSQVSVNINPSILELSLYDICKKYYIELYDTYYREKRPTKKTKITNVVYNIPIMGYYNVF